MVHPWYKDYPHKIETRTKATFARPNSKAAAKVYPWGRKGAAGTKYTFRMLRVEHDGIAETNTRSPKCQHRLTCKGSSGARMYKVGNNIQMLLPVCMGIYHRWSRH